MLVTVLLLLFLARKEEVVVQDLNFCLTIFSRS